MIVPIGIGFALIVLAIIITLLVRRQLREKYALLWLVIGFATLALAIFPGMLSWLADLFGVAVPSNLLFALALALLIGVTLHLSWELSTAEEEIRRVAEEIAILRADVDWLRADLAARERDPGAATAVAGVGGYAIQLLAPALLDDAHSYLAFSVFWSAIYLFVAAISGVQQEVTRATRPSDVPASRPTLRTFTFIAAAVIAVISIVVGFTLAPVAFTADPAAMTFWFGVGLVGYLLTAVLAGVMYGLSLWRAIAALIVADSLIRVILVLLGLFLHVPPAMLAVAISVPFVLAFGLVWIAVHRRLVGRFALDVGARRLSLNSLGTVAAAAATGVMVTGLPLLIRATMPDAPATLIASLILIITITRAPLIVPLMALQSFLIVDFRAAGPRIRPRLILFLGLAAAATVVGALLAAALGPWIAEAISAGRYTVSAGVAAAVVVSAGLVAMMCITGPALLSEGRHVPYVAGWLTAAGLTIGLLLPAVDPTLRVLGALIVPPAIGLVVHLASVRSFDPPDGGGDARGR